MLARCRDEIRNNPWAASAVDNFESQVIGKGIWPTWPNVSPALKKSLESEFRRWATAPNVNFPGLQSTAAREIFEGGEVFCRRLIRPSSWGLRVPLELQLIEAEQVPIFLSSISGFGTYNLSVANRNSVRTGIEFDQWNRIVAYHMYREHPGETMFYPLEGLTFTRVPAADLLHVFKRQRAGLLRGQPHLAATLQTLHELDKYMDAAVVKKQIQTMFAGFIEKVSPDQDILPVDTSSPSAGQEQTTPPPPAALATDWGVQNTNLETGTVQVLFAGEKITFPTLPQDTDIETFLRVCLHQFAVGIGATYEQITGDLRGVNLSSIRAGILDFRRKCEQLQLNLIISQFLAPVTRWWLREAVIAGVLTLPGYDSDPGLYDDIAWALPGWPWIDPLKDAQANQLNVRDGFDSRENVVAQQGGDVATIDAQQIADNKRADVAGLVYDSDPRKVLGRGEKATAEGGEDAVKPEDSNAKSDAAKGGSDSTDDL
jgi:lambda family phage portal protein